MEIDKVFLFRISSAFFIFGLSLICFLTGALSKQRSNGLFAVIHAYSAGILLGMGFLFDDPDGIAHINHESTYSAVYIACLSFVGMLGVEYFNAVTHFDYSAVLTVDDTEEEFSSEHNSGIEMSGVGDSSIGDVEDPSECEFSQIKDQSFASQISSRAFKFHPLILLFFASASDMVGGIHLSSEEHYGVQLFVVVLIHKALMACAFGTLLESSTAPRSLFLYFMLTYCSSSAVGILSGTMMSKYGFVTPQLMRSTRNTDLVITALTAGVYLFIATMKMIPASLVVDPKREQDSSDASLQAGEKPIKFAMFIGGFLFAVVPKLLLP